MRTLKIESSYIKHILWLIIGVVMTSCSKDEKMQYYEPTGPLTVKIDKTSASKGTPFMLSFTGIADSVLFYSGKDGHVYEYRNRIEMEGVKPFLSFTSYSQWGAQQNTLKVLVSNDFDGDYDDAGINSATWIDVTSQATLSTGQDNTPSGEIDLTSGLAAGKPLYIAFKFVGAAGTTQKTWTIKNLNFSSLLPNGVINKNADVGSAGWVGYNVKNTSAVWKMTASQIQMAGGNETAAENEDWIISKAFYTNKVEPDRGEVIRSRYQLMLKDYKFVYDAPGTYKAVVITKDGKGETQKETVNEFELTIN